MCHGKPFKIKIQQKGGGGIEVPRPSASALLTGRRQKDNISAHKIRNCSQKSQLIKKVSY
jgi:hypothetical protein